MLKKISTIWVILAISATPLYAKGLYSPMNGAISIRSESLANKCLSFGTSQDGTLQAIPCNKDDSTQFWQLIQANNQSEYLLISNQAPARCLDASSDTPVLTSCDYGAATQHWNLFLPGDSPQHGFGQWKYRLQSESSKKCLAMQTAQQIDTVPRALMVSCDNGNNQQFTFAQKTK